MDKDSILRLQEDNKERLNSYNQEIQEMTDELAQAEQHLVHLQMEKQDDKNIFSPRVQDSSTDDQLHKTQDEIRRINQTLDFVRQLVESESRMKDICQELVLESERSESYSEETTTKATEPTDQHLASSFSDLLDSIYKKLEYSLSLISGNKNRCRSELKSVEHMIRDYQEKLRNGSY